MGAVRNFFADGFAFVKLVISPSTATDPSSTDPTITSGSAAPSASEPKGSLYIRTGGSSGDTVLYVATDAVGTWTPLGAAATLTSHIAAADPYLPEEITDPGNAGAVPVTESGVCHIVTAGAETRTVADPAAVGLTLSLFFLTDGGNAVVTFASPVNEAGNNTLTLADVTEAAHFVSVRDGASAYRWALVGSNLNNGTLTTV